MDAQITLEAVESFMRMIGVWYRGSWQRDMMRHLCENRYAIIQGPRQNSGKTWVTAIFIAYLIWQGKRILMGMPTQEQGSRILIDRVDEFIHAAEMRTLGGPNPLTRTKADNVKYKKWTNGAILGVKSMDSSAKGGVQGFTIDAFIVDEAHIVETATFDAAAPAGDIAEMLGEDRVILLGIGEDFDECLIAVKKIPVKDDDEDDPAESFACVRLTPDIICDSEFYDHDPRFTADKMRRFFRKKQKKVSPDIWRQHYLCLPKTAGLRRMFPHIASDIPAMGTMPRDTHFSIDTGKGECNTVLSTWEVVEYGGMPLSLLVDVKVWNGDLYADQAAEIADYILTGNYQGVQLHGGYKLRTGDFIQGARTFLPRNVAYESNGPGSELGGYLERIYPFGDITSVHTNDQAPHFRKSWLLTEHVMPAAREGRLAIAEGVEYQGVPAAKALSRLAYEFKPNGQYEWPGNDLLSTLWVHVAGLQTAAGV